MQLDVWRYIMFNRGTPSEHCGHFLFKKEDFTNFKWLPEDWWYFLNKHGDGYAADFPIKIKHLLSWSSEHFVKKDGKLTKGKRFPLEKLCITIVKRPCNFDNLHA